MRPEDGALKALVGERPVWIADAGGARAYSAVDWRTPSVLVIGSEASGPSSELRALATGEVAIPLGGPIESLNAAVAASIMLFEAARQVASTNE
jgi:TrmH family RNA methyltransferase